MIIALRRRGRLSQILSFETEPQRTRLETSVTGSGEAEGHPFVVLADTILYPEGGGQPADHGTIAGISVIDVQKVDGEVRHVLAEPVTAERVTVELEWSRRFDHMQQHTGQHLLTAIAEAKFGWSTTAFHLGDTTSDIEVDAPSPSDEQVLELEEAVAAEIRAARPVTARRVSAQAYAEMPVRSRGLPSGHTGSVRLVEIEGIDVNTCGGTHCSSTAELEALKLLGTEPVRGGTRLFFVAGARLRKLLGAHHLRNAALRSIVGTSDDGLVDGVQVKLGQLKASHRALREVEEALATACADGLAQKPDRVLVAHWPNRGLPFLQQVARRVDALFSDRVVLLTAGEAEEGAFLLGAGEATSVDVSAVGVRVAEVLGGRGGGSGRVFQGRASQLGRRSEALSLLEQEVGRGAE